MPVNDSDITVAFASKRMNKLLKFTVLFEQIH